MSGVSGRKSMVSRDRDNTIGGLLTQYGIDHSKMPEESWSPELTTVYTFPSGETDPNKVDAVYGESSNGKCRVVIGRVKVQDVSAFAVMSVREIAYRLSDLPMVGGQVGQDQNADIIMSYGGTGLVTDALSPDAVDQINANINKAWPNNTKPPLFPPGKPIPRTQCFAAVSLEVAQKGATIIVPDINQNPGPYWMDISSGTTYKIAALYCRRIGVSYTAGKSGDIGFGQGGFNLQVWFDGSLGLGTPNPGETEQEKKEREVKGDKGNGLTIEIIGLNLGCSTGKDCSWDFVAGIQGLGLDYRMGPVEIGGGLALIHNDKYDPLVEGGAILSAMELNFQVMAAWARAKKPPVFTSLFIFSEVQSTGKVPEGVEVFPGVTITGFCIGFGYNSHLRIPGPGEVLSFPLLTPLLSLNKPTNTPLAALENLTDGDSAAWVTPQDGGFWGAIGLKVNLYEMLNVWGLLVIDIQKSGEWSAALISITSLEIPKIVKLQIAREAEISSGVLAIGGSLTAKSYMLTENLHPMGGLDLVFWIGGEHRGEWLFTAGGYGPLFTPAPAYYPVIKDRIGIRFGISDELSASGLYYLTVSNAGMAVGGEIRLDLKLKIWKVTIEGWLRFTFDMLMTWSPHFSLDFKAGLNAGVRAKFLCFHASLELSLSVQGWLSPFGARATLELPFHTSWDFDLGAPPPAPAKPLSWEEVVGEKLGSAALTAIHSVSGRLSVPGTPDADSHSQPVERALPGTHENDFVPQPWMVSAHGFTFTTHCVVPSTDIIINPDHRYPLDYQSGRTLNVRPMGTEKGTGLTSKHTVTITRNNDQLLLEDDGWKVTVVSENVSEAMWGVPLPPDTPPDMSGGLVPGQYTGIRFTVPDAIPGAALPGIDINKDLGYEPMGPASDLPIGPDLPVPGGDLSPQPDPNSIAAIAAIAGGSAAAARERLNSTLDQQGYSPKTNGSLTRYADRVHGGLFDAAPLTLAAA